ncbi:hypothetical protein HHI36_017814 [Cryptolaemus montrouzieri]|uniref:PiggyBac transposable element-derived protein domain-containing protein n=1 Tax=Cryptolaemus montrouzieri TaxID=559131 RepID=A0ABD2NQ81_9CUCU
MKHLQKLYDELMSDENIDVADPYADCNTSDEYEPSESEISNDDYKVLPKKAKRLKKSEVNESTQDDQPGVSNCAKSSNGSDDQPVHTAQKLAQQPMNPKAKSKPWFHTDCEEIERFFGIFVWMGLMKTPQLRDYWSRSFSYQNNIGKVMTRNRFE